MKTLNKNFEAYRIIFAAYNMHYYINVFLLALMSIERCMAVKKSLQCQRYKFKVSRIGLFVDGRAINCDRSTNNDWLKRDVTPGNDWHK